MVPAVIVAVRVVGMPSSVGPLFCAESPAIGMISTMTVKASGSTLTWQSPLYRVSEWVPPGMPAGTTASRVLELTWVTEISQVLPSLRTGVVMKFVPVITTGVFS